MTGLELEIIYNSDKEKYILEKNEEFKKNYDSMEKEGFRTIINLKKMQELINIIVSFYEFKYPNIMLQSMKFSDDYAEMLDAKRISKMLDLKQLKWRLYCDFVQFLDYSYFNFIKLYKKRETIHDVPDILLRINADGSINEKMLDKLVEYEFIDSVEGVCCAKELYNKFLESKNKVDYSQLKDCIKYYDYNIMFRNELLKLIPLALFYSKDTLPEYGYIRAKSFIRTFNMEYGLDMNLEELDEILNKDNSEICRKRKMI